MSDRCVTTFHDDDVRVVEIQERMVAPRRASVTVIGEIDHSTSALLHAALLRTWEAGPVAVVIDLRQVTFLNAAGLRALLLTGRTARLRDVPLVLLAGPGQVTRVLTMVGFGQQVLSSPEGTGSHATGPAVGLPALRLVAAPDDDGGKATPAPQDVGTAVTGPTRRADLRSVPVRRTVLPASDKIVAAHGGQGPHEQPSP